jgi:hypothetical protein
MAVLTWSASSYSSCPNTGVVAKTTAATLPVPFHVVFSILIVSRTYHDFFVMEYDGDDRKWIYGVKVFGASEKNYSDGKSKPFSPFV